MWLRRYEGLRRGRALFFQSSDILVAHLVHLALGVQVHVTLRRRYSPPAATRRAISPALRSACRCTSPPEPVSSVALWARSLLRARGVVGHGPFEGHVLLRPAGCRASPVTPLTVSAGSIDPIDGDDSIEGMDSIDASESSLRPGRGRGSTPPFSILVYDLLEP